MNLTYTEDKLVHKWGNMLIKDEMGEFGLLLSSVGHDRHLSPSGGPTGGLQELYLSQSNKGYID